MAKFNLSDIDNYSSGEFGYFSLKEDGDTARVRFMYNSSDDIEGYAVHRVKVNGFDRMVSCLREYSDPLDKCPLCEAHYNVIPKFYIPLYNIDTGDVVFWERGKNFVPQLMDFCTKCNPPVAFPVEIERIGAKGDINTKYEFYPEANDGTLLEDLPEIPNPIGTIVLDKTYDELVTYVNTGSFDVGDSNPINRDNGGVEQRRRRDTSATTGGGIPRRRGTNGGNTPL